MTITAVLVSHNGSRWLPAVLRALEAQRRLPTRLVAVDTGSTDGSGELLRRAFGADAVVDAPARTPYGRAVEIALRHVDHTAPVAAGEGAEWVWLLQDDAAPAPDALQRLVEAAAENPSAAAFGPKLREWPSLRRLLEVGVTISGTGRRETGLERGEYDQGQHDQVRDVLAVNGAGMLIRRDVLEELGGLDPTLPVLGADLDLGWRAARAGHRTLVVPEAVLFHAEATQRGLRDGALARRPRREERRAALYTLLVHSAVWLLPLRLLRLTFGTLVRALGLLLLRAPREAVDEVAALASVLLRPDRLAKGMLSRRRIATVPRREVRPKLAPFWLPYRHGLDVLSDLASTVVDAAIGREGSRAPRPADIDSGPVPEEAQSLPADTGLLARLLASPVALVLAGLFPVSLLAERGLLGPGVLAGGALLPAPDGALAWWQTHVAAWHETGLGSSAPAPAYILPLALAGTLLLGQAGWVLDVLFVLTVPLAALGAYRLARTVVRSRAAALWGSVTYALLPVLQGAVQQGRLGTVAAAVLLPWLVRSVLHLRPGTNQARRRRAAWGTSLWLALLAAFVPVAWFIAAVLAGVALVALLASGRGRGAGWGPLVLPLPVSAALLLPWWGPVLLGAGAGPATLLLEAGVPDLGGTLPVGSTDVVLGRAGDVGTAPWWVTPGLVLAAVGTLLREDRRGPVLTCWSVLLAGLGALVVTAGRAVPVGDELAALPVHFPLLLVHAAAVLAVALAADGIVAKVSRSTFGWQQPVAAVLGVLALTTPALGVAWWVVAGGSGPVDRHTGTPVPVYMAEAALADPVEGVLVLSGDRSGFDYHLWRGDGPRTGDGLLLPDDDSREEMDRLVARLIADPSPEDVPEVAAHGVRHIYAPAPVDRRLATALDTASGLAPASATQRGARAWRLEAEPTMDALPVPSGTPRWPAAVLQGIAVLGVAVLASPGKELRR